MIKSQEEWNKRKVHKFLSMGYTPFTKFLYPFHSYFDEKFTWLFDSVFKFILTVQFIFLSVVYLLFFYLLVICIYVFWTLPILASSLYFMKSDEFDYIIEMAKKKRQVEKDEKPSRLKMLWIDFKETLKTPFLGLF